MEDSNKINEESDRNLNANDNNKTKDANHSDKSEELDISQNWNQTGIKNLNLVKNLDAYHNSCNLKVEQKEIKDLKLVKNLDACYNAVENKIELSIRKKYLIKRILGEYNEMHKKTTFKAILQIKMLREHLMLLAENEYCGSDELKKFTVDTFVLHDRITNDFEKMIEKYTRYVQNSDNNIFVEKLIKYHEA